MGGQELSPPTSGCEKIPHCLQIFCLLLFLEVGWKYHSCCWFKWKLFFVKQSLYYFCLQVTVPTISQVTLPTISQVTVPNRFIRIGRDGSISYSQAPIPLNLRTHIPHPFLQLLMCSCSIEVEHLKMKELIENCSDSQSQRGARWTCANIPSILR